MVSSVSFRTERCDRSGDEVGGPIMNSRAGELAEAVLIVIRRILKWLAIAIGGVLAIGALAAAGYWAWGYLTYDLPKSKVEIVTGVGDDRCTADHPVFVGVVNRSDRTVLKTSIRLQAFIPGRSTNFATWNRMSDDRIIKPGDGFGQCWRPVLESSVPEGTDPRALEWSVADYSVEFAR